MTLSVIGAGLGRTGTLSLKLALERLGFGPCYHTRELLKQLDAHVAVWNRAADGDVVDWDALYEGYSSAVDFPTAGFYRELRDDPLALDATPARSSLGLASDASEGSRQSYI